MDGAYINVNISKHLSNSLDLSTDLMNDSVIWDGAHRLELACIHSKEGYQFDGQSVGGTNWLLELDGMLQHIMKLFRFGHAHTELRNIANERNQVFLEFNLIFRDTFYRMHI